MTELNSQEKIALIKQGLQEVLREEIIRKVIEDEKRPLKIYWGELILFLLSIITVEIS